MTMRVNRLYRPCTGTAAGASANGAAMRAAAREAHSPASASASAAAVSGRRQWSASRRALSSHSVVWRLAALLPLLLAAPGKTVLVPLLLVAVLAAVPRR